MESEAPRFIRDSPPVMATWYSPAVSYVWDMVPSVVCVEDSPSPQDTDSVSPVCTSTGMLTSRDPETGFQVVTKTLAGSTVTSSTLQLLPSSNTVPSDAVTLTV